MTRQEQRNFVKEITKNLQKKILEKVANVPENWDGIELRRFVGDYYDCHFKEVGDLSGKRKKDYNNELLINPKLL